MIYIDKTKNLIAAEFRETIEFKRQYSPSRNRPDLRVDAVDDLAVVGEISTLRLPSRSIVRVNR